MFLFSRSNSGIFKDNYKKRIKEFIEENDNFKDNVINEGPYEWNEFKIENFKKLLNSYESLESLEFNFLNHQWKIRIYFYGKFKNDNDYFKFSLININKKNNYIPVKFVPYFKISNTNDVDFYSSSLLYNFNNNSCYEYKIYYKEFKNFINSIDNNNLHICIGVYMRIYNNSIIDKYVKDKLAMNEIRDIYYKKENDVYFEWAIKDWEQIKKLPYFESPLFINNNDKWAIVIKNGIIHLKCYSFSLDENHFHVKGIISIRYSDDFSKGYLSEESGIYNKENEITFNKELINIETGNKEESIEKIKADTIVICVYIIEYLNIQENYINKLKNILIEDDSRNKNSIKRINRNYFEHKIENISNFINQVNDQSSEEFEVGNYKWKFNIVSFFNDICKEYNNINISLENTNNFNNFEEFVTCKYLFYIKSSSKHYSFKPSSLCIFNNAKKRSEYLIIDKNMYNKTIKSFIENDNSLTIGVYIFIYDNFIIQNFFNEIKEKGMENNYDILNNGYYEWEISDWDKLQKENISVISSTPFKIEDYYWNITFYPKEENFSQILYFSNNFDKNKNKNNYLRCIFVIRNCNDFSCYEIQKSKITPMEYNMEMKNEIDEDNILPIKYLKSYEISKRRLIENNKVIFGVYIFKMKKKNKNKNRRKNRNKRKNYKKK